MARNPRKPRTLNNILPSKTRHEPLDAQVQRAEHLIDVRTRTAPSARSRAQCLLEHTELVDSQEVHDKTRVVWETGFWTRFVSSKEEVQVL